VPSPSGEGGAERPVRAPAPRFAKIDGVGGLPSSGAPRRLLPEGEGLAHRSLQTYDEEDHQSGLSGAR
jgi:hypothetical protein